MPWEAFPSIPPRTHILFFKNRLFVITRLCVSVWGCVHVNAGVRMRIRVSEEARRHSGGYELPDMTCISNSGPLLEPCVLNSRDISPASTPNPNILSIQRLLCAGGGGTGLQSQHSGIRGRRIRCSGPGLAIYANFKGNPGHLRTPSENNNRKGCYELVFLAHPPRKCTVVTVLYFLGSSVLHFLTLGCEAWNLVP